MLALAGGAVLVAVIVLLVFSLPGGGGGKTSSSSASAPESLPPGLGEPPLKAPASIGPYQLQSGPGSTVESDSNIVDGFYVRPGMREALVFSATRVLDPQRVAEFVRRYVSDLRATFFAPGASQAPVTSGGVQYTCLTGTGVGSAAQEPAAACVWAGSLSGSREPVTFQLFGSGQGLDQQALLTLAPQAQAATAS